MPYDLLAKLGIVVFGTGTVGSALIDELLENEYFHSREIRIVMLCNSKKFVACPEKDWRDRLDKSDTFEFSTVPFQLLESCKHSSYHLVIVDCTANARIAANYPTFLERGISVVTANKIGPSGSMHDFWQLPMHAVPFSKVLPKLGFESTVGAGLPIIKTIRSAMASGDHIRKIEGILSGTLAFIMNSFMPVEEAAEADLESILEEAQKRGFTEPDPCEDLRGMDVARKVTILARLMGIKVGRPDDVISPLLTPQCKDIKALSKTLAARREECRANGTFLRYVARISHDGIKIGLDELARDSPFLHAKGCDNMVIIVTTRFPSGIIIQGNGAGPSATIHGILADIADIYACL